MVRIYIVVIVLLVSGLSAQVDLPTVDVTGEIQRTNADTVLRGADPADLIAPGSDPLTGEGLLLSSEGVGLAGRPPAGKEAIFSLGYGMYDNLTSSLIFGNQLGSFTYMVSYDSVRLDDFYVVRNKILNSAENLTDLVLNTGYSAEKFTTAWVLKYFQKDLGLQGNTNFFNSGRRIVSASSINTWTLSGSKRIRLDLDYAWIRYSVNDQFSEISDSMQSIKGQLKYLSLWSDINDYFIYLEGEYRGLDGPAAIRELGRLKGGIHDTFQLFNSVSFLLKAEGLLTSNRFYFLPGLSLSFVMSEKLVLKIAGGIDEDENSLSGRLNSDDYLLPVDRPLRSSLRAFGSVGFKSVLGKMPLSGEVRYSSSRDFSFLAEGQYDLLMVNYLNTDHLEADLRMKFIKRKSLLFYFSYLYQLYERRVTYEPLNTFRLRCEFMRKDFFAGLTVDYVTDIHSGNRYLRDVVILDLSVEQKLFTTIDLVFHLKNCLNRDNRYYENFIEPGFLANAGLKINLF